jgi:DNA-nicking Smr family endonuclease
VLAYCDATPKDGGSGAVLVLLKVTEPPINYF